MTISPPSGEWTLGGPPIVRRGTLILNSVGLTSLPDQFSVGAFADSAHEYLLKQYLLTGQSEPKVLDLCKTSPLLLPSSR